MVAPINRESRSGLYQCADVGCEGSHFRQAGSVSCASKISRAVEIEDERRVRVEPGEALDQP
jgi:hypothetical protein